MIIDCHTHTLYPSVPGGAGDLVEACEKLDGCIVLAVPNEKGSSVANKQLSGYVSGRITKMYGFALVNPLCDSVTLKSIAAIRDDMLLKGLVLYCCGQGFHPAHSRAMRVYEAAEELSLPIFFHNGPPLEPDAVLDYAQPFQLDEIARKFKSLKMVIGNMGVPFVEQTVCMVSKHQNVYADLTISPSRVWQLYNIVISASQHNVMEKLLFGSGFPSGNAGACMEALLGFNRLLADTNLPTVPRGNIRSIIERNTLHVLGIKTDGG
ncbi:MAG: amidohydrolase family protein [Planctomycetota bacterium]